MLFMFHASAAFNGGDIQNFGEGGRTLYGGIYHFMWGLNNPLETMEINQNDKMAMVRQRYQLIHSSNTDNPRVLESDWIRATPRQTQLTVLVLDAIFTCWWSLRKKHLRHQLGLSTDIAGQRILQSVWTRVVSGHVHKW